MVATSTELESLYRSVISDELSAGDIVAALEELASGKENRGGLIDPQGMHPLAKIPGEDLTLFASILQRGFEKALQERKDEEDEMLSQGGHAGEALASIASRMGLQRVSGEAAKAAALVHAAVQCQLQSQLQYYVYEQAGLHLIQSLFDLVIDFPDSLPALQDLRSCLEHTSLLSRMARDFQATTRRRLLHPGAATTDIVQQYILSIKALGHVDATGTGLAPAKAAIQEYLRHRADAIRCIVGLLTSEEESGNGILEEELAAAGDAAPDTALRSMDVLPYFEGPDVDLQALAEAERWVPAPVESSPHAAAGDAVSQLVGIWGSHDLFVSEYRTMLGDRLLAKSDYDCDHELKTLELLKLRFGEPALHTAEIMLKVQAMLQAYGGGYHRLKSPRKLVWSPSRGQVTLEVSVGGQSMECTVSPAQATVLLAFREAKELSEKELAALTGLEGPALARAAEYWSRKGILGPTTALPGGVKGWARREQLEGESGAGCHEDDMMADAAEAGPQLTVGLQIMETYEPFILGMLANFDALPLDRIHNMLKMFASDPPYDRSMDDLAAYLKHMALKDMIVAEGGGVFRQKKP